jgi:putative transposase/transposase-like zinc-binding protein
MAQVLLPPRLEVADILRAHGETYQARHPLSAQQRVVLRRLTACRTAALGGHVDACAGCGFRRISYNSCRDRHCPKCQALKRAQWLETRLQRLLPVPHFHVVFTLPEALKPLLLRNQRILYELLFRTSAQALLELGADPKRLGAQLGITTILHTWGQNLLFHPHLHCVVTAGGLAADGSRWLATRPNYLLPVKALAKLFQGKFLAGLKELYGTERLDLRGSVAALTDRRVFAHLLDRLYQQKWVVFAKRPFARAEHVFRYLGRYSHRVAISNARLVSMEDGQVRFRWKDYADGHRLKVMSVSAEEFVRRFLLHVLPKRFVRIRHYGVLAGRNVATKLARCRQLLGDATVTVQPATPVEKTWTDWLMAWSATDPLCCPRCQGPLTRQALLLTVVGPPSSGGAALPGIPTIDSS